MEERIPLWTGPVPFADQCPGQQAPGLTAFPAAGARGAVVVIPGGGYSHKAAHEGEPIARMLNSAGIAAYVLPAGDLSKHKQSYLITSVYKMLTLRIMRSTNCIKSQFIL